MGGAVVQSQAADERAVEARSGVAASLWMLGPPLAALAYPHILKTFSAQIADRPSDPAGIAIVTALLLAAMSVPLYALYTAARLGRIDHPSAFQVRARRLAFFSMAAPPLFVLFGVGLGLVGSPVRDVTAWTVCWAGATLYGVVASRRTVEVQRVAPPKLRIFHGATAALLVIFVAFHLSNHLVGLLGPDAHARVMAVGRTVYRSGAVEPLLIALLLTQIVTGGRLAWRWTTSGGDWHRTLQIGSGVYLGAFIVTHLNSALISARLVRDLPTNWAWASGAPEGLLYDAWNIRLLPHYAFGVLFVAVHLSSGLRIVLMAHGVGQRAANMIWIAGAVAGAAVATAIVAALLGARI